MKLKDSFITYVSDGQQIMVDASAKSFVGLVRSNETAAFIIDLLKTDTTAEKIISAMCEKYDAPAEKIAMDVKAVLSKLSSIGALNE